MAVFGALEILAAETAVAVVVGAFAVVVVEYSDDDNMLLINKQTWHWA